ncbi:MFS transporter [Cronobacter dublinensis]|uniref:MFS transporter n=1 Tax=Cronobacter dublinensis TaxID=413497 RepID=UPI000CFCDA1D|nr:MFS transporter [Cronobacter dublinensis]ELY4511777.1 MFS transporter [Cronobacter dublinensis]MDT3604566.1 MFS transporter [Cronobacter dublinensis]
MTLFSSLPGDEGLPGRERALAMTAVMTSTTMAVFDGAMVNIALPDIARELQVSAADAVWVANGYLLAAAMTLAIFAALAGRLGFRTLFAAGVGLFTLASLGCALADSLGMLVAMRFLQGIGGAATLSIAPAILRTIFPNRLLGRILGMNALLIATSTAVAPVLGGALLAWLGWPWLFAINLAPGALALWLTLRTLPQARRPARGPFDVSGALLSALMLGAAVMAPDAVSLSATLGWAALAALSGAALVWRLKRAPEPLLPPQLFASPRFTLAALTSLASFISQGMTFVALPFLFQSVYGYSALNAALLFTAWPVGIMLVAPHAGRLADRHAPSLIATVGLAVFVGGLVALALLPAHASAWDISLRGLLCGTGFGIFQSPNNREMLANASREHSGYASGVLAIMRMFGQCVGAALVGVIFALGAPGTDALAQASGVRLALWVAALASLLALGFSLSRLRRG